MHAYGVATIKNLPHIDVLQYTTLHTITASDRTIQYTTWLQHYICVNLKCINTMVWIQLLVTCTVHGGLFVGSFSKLNFNYKGFMQITFLHMLNSSD